MQSTPMLVTGDWVAHHARDPKVRLFDCTGNIDSETVPPRALSGRVLYDRGHVPGAAYLDLLHDFSGPPSPSLFYTLLPPRVFAARAGAAGIGKEHHVVLYSSLRPSWATRAWWLLRLHGFERISLLQNGWEGWVLEGRSVSLDERRFSPSNFELQYRRELLMGQGDVADAIAKESSSSLVNALSPAQFFGTDEVHYGRPGHIPRSVNLPYTSLLNEDLNGFRQDSTSKRLLKEASGDADRVIAYCGGGVGATALAFAWALHGRDDVAVYNGSMIEWSSNPENPVDAQE